MLVRTFVILDGTMCFSTCEVYTYIRMYMLTYIRVHGTVYRHAHIHNIIFSKLMHADIKGFVMSVYSIQICMPPFLTHYEKIQTHVVSATMVTQFIN